jgi:hypothetical protein
MLTLNIFDFPDEELPEPMPHHSSHCAPGEKPRIKQICLTKSLTQQPVIYLLFEKIRTRLARSIRFQGSESLAVIMSDEPIHF